MISRYVARPIRSGARTLLILMMLALYMAVLFENQVLKLVQEQPRIGSMMRLR